MWPRIFRQPVRNQVEFRMSSIDELLPEDHRARLVWRYVEKLDISSLVIGAHSFAGSGGAPTTDPRMLLALWLFAILDGVGSARELASANETTLINGFAGESPSITTAYLVMAGIVDLSCIAVDSMRVRANAGRSSFRRKETLLELQRLAKARIEQLKTEAAADPAATSRRQQARRERAERERSERLEAALKAVDGIRRRYDALPDKLLADVGYDSQADIEAVEAMGTAVYVPLPKKEKDRQPKPRDRVGVRQ